MFRVPHLVFVAKHFQEKLPRGFQADSASNARAVSLVTNTRRGVVVIVVVVVAIVVVVVVLEGGRRGEGGGGGVLLLLR